MGVRLNGKLLKEMRRADGLRQEDLLALCEGQEDTSISERSLRNAEAGRSVGVDVYTRLARVFRVDPADQLLAVKALTLKQLRRQGADDVSKFAGLGSHPDRGRPAGGVTRV